MSDDAGSTPTAWSDTENLQWKTELPGPGLSSPIVVGDRVYVTSWTGFEAGEGSSDNPEDLKRALVCMDRNTGDLLWTKSVDAVLPEDEFRGMFAENGYASHTPACDGEKIYCFFGKSGVVAFDLEGNQLWQTSVGTGRDPRGWGSASSPVLYENLVIVTASAESESLVALDQETGQQVWKEEAPTLAGTWSTPVVVQVDDDRTDLVISVPGELWGINPKMGKLRWYCLQPGGESNSVTSSVVVSEGPDPVAYVLGGRDNGSMAVKIGGALEIELFSGGSSPVAGVDFDQLTADSASLGGELQVLLDTGYTPTLGDSFPILTTANGVTGTFATESLPGLADGLRLVVRYDANDVALLVTTILSGDYNDDGVVDAADYTVWRDNLGAVAGTLPNDTDGGVIGTPQYTTWRANFGATLPPSASLSNATVPEPSTSVLVTLFALGTTCRCRRTRR